MAYSVSPSSTSVNESVGTITFTVTRTTSATAETVYFSTSQNQGTLNSGDYVGILNQPLVFLAGQTSKTVTLSIINDSTPEGAESFGIILDTLAGTVLDTSTFTILANDTAASTFSLTPASTSVTEGGQITFTVTRSSSTGSETVYFSTNQNQGSSNSNDYTGILDQAVTFTAGQTTKQVTVSTINDSNPESSEQFSIVLDNAGGTILDTSVFTILDNDAAVTGPEVTVLGGGISIVDGDSSPSTSDGTNFGSATVGGSGVTKTFTVRNDGTSTLNLSSLAASGGFTIVEGLPTSLAAGASNTFQVKMNASTTGTKTGTISFTTNDSNETAYNFSVSGSVSTAPVASTWSKPVGLDYLPFAGAGRVTQGFGGDTSHGSADNTRDYAWLDFAAGIGTPLVAMANGVVIGRRTGSFSGDTAEGQFGNYVTIKFDSGLIVTYAHLSSVSIAINSRVTAGSTIVGLSGDTGNVDGAHLHLSFGTTTTGSSGLLRAAIATTDGSNGSPGFFKAHFASSSENAGLLGTIMKTDIFGSAEARYSDGTARPNSDQDELLGGAVDNRIFGGSGNDRLYGAGGNDILVGGTGGDRLKGGIGIDQLIGGAGKDVFDFDRITESGATYATCDTISDYSRTQLDKIDVSTIAGTFSFIGTSGFSANSINQVRFSKVDRNSDGIKESTLVLLDNDSDTGAESVILLKNFTGTLISTDFIL